MQIDVFKAQSPRSILFITLDSCRYDTFVAANAINLKSIGPLYRAMAPGNFTFSSHAAMFMGFTPGVTEKAEPYINPKFAKFFKMSSNGFQSKNDEFVTLDGRNIVDGFKRLGYKTIGTGAVEWFNPTLETGQVLSSDFDDFFYPGNTFSLSEQLVWVADRLVRDGNDQPVFLFLNIGETHVPYYFKGAPWDATDNPCVPFSNSNDAKECYRRQKACLEYIDRLLGPLLNAFAGGTTVVCADHGDCWGEDGLWEHGIHHEKVFEVPLLFRLRDKD